MPKKNTQPKTALTDAISLIDQATQALAKARQLLDLAQRDAPREEKKGSPPVAGPPIPEWRLKDFL